MTPGNPAPTGPVPPDPFPEDYRFVRRVGGGACGEVWLVEELSPLRRLLAVKRLHPNRQVTAAILGTLERDAEHLGGLRHPNIVPVHAWRTAAGQPYLVMDHIAGGSLEQRVELEGPLPWQLAARYVADVAEALALVHEHGVLHRDIKPANILWDAEQDEALLMDFGIAARLSVAVPIGGTPPFMSPEAWAGRPEQASDVFSLAVTLFWLLSRRFPFPGPNYRAQIEAGLPSPHSALAAVPEALEVVLRTGLRADASSRPSAAAFARRLRNALNLTLADTFATVGDNPVNQRLIVSRANAAGVYEVLTATPPAPRGADRDLRVVPPLPPVVCLRTGDEMRLEVVADVSGRVSVFNVGPTGNLTSLTPVGGVELRACQRLHLVDAELEEPSGRERIIAVWTRQPVSLTPRDLLTAGAADGPGLLSKEYRSTREIRAVERALQELAPEDRVATVLDIDHLPPGP